MHGDFTGHLFHTSLLKTTTWLVLNIKAYSKGPFRVADSHLIKAGPVMQPFRWFNLGMHEIFQVIWYVTKELAPRLALKTRLTVI